ncbi:MAG TPA: hypothetical protein VFM70_04715 [Salinimicrobium sp.]|nr:hypothetical protein [Salinimicrobium sp.]
MFQGLETYLLFGNHFCGVEHSSKEGKDTINVTVLKKKKNELQMESSCQVNSVTGLSSEIGKNKPVFVVINTDNVLLKKIENQQLEPVKLVNLAFPNIRTEEFYYEILSNGKNHFISICRKDYVNNLITEYISNKIAVTGFSLGASIVSSISEFFKAPVVFTSSLELEFDNGELNKINKIAEPPLEHYEINGLKMESKDTLSFAGAINMVLKNHTAISNFDGKSNTLKDQFKQLRFFDVFLKFGIAFLLVLLLINFFFFNHYYNSVQSLQQVSQVNLQSKNKIIELREKVDTKQEIVENMMANITSRSSFYVNEIIQSLPSSILLNSLNFQPLLKNIKKGQLIEIDTDVIEISGDSRESDVFSEWIYELESLTWVKKVEVMEYSDAADLSSFKVQITFSENEK